MWIKKKEVAIQMPVKGELIPIEEVNDPIFSSKTMGEGFAVRPKNGKIFAPVSGKVISIFETKHAIGIETKNGVSLLIHMGIDSVELKGIPFTLFASEGREIKQGSKIAEMDLAYFKEAGKSDDVVFVLTEKDQYKNFSIDQYGDISLNEKIGAIVI
ncbi:PTS glucose transporter subunit IIA [Enterococcus hulanensis]|uniref:PTS sugar transporter subunit IIA n=1 Tax=Enterococcus hulanensis TaxID=2559929 RepID=UPI001A8EE2B5|nr:PTS glucose transporter subunit IIA [Enterococcus hulanensis]MBO0458524.1 PTS glucose transporter subunit IIA [Enterococcus hulanensis]